MNQKTPSKYEKTKQPLESKPVKFAWKKKAKQLRDHELDLQKVIALLEVQLSVTRLYADDEPPQERLFPKELENLELMTVIEELLVFDAVVRVHGLNAAPFDRARAVLRKYEKGK